MGGQRAEQADRKAALREEGTGQARAESLPADARFVYHPHGEGVLDCLRRDNRIRVKPSGGTVYGTIRRGLVDTRVFGHAPRGAVRPALFSGVLMFR